MSMKVGDKVRILANRYCKVEMTGIIVRPDTVPCSKWQHPSGRIETGRWEVMIDEEFRHLYACINAEGCLGFWPVEMQVIKGCETQKGEVSW